MACQQPGNMNKKAARPRRAWRLPVTRWLHDPSAVDQCTPCIHFFMTGVKAISTTPAAMGMMVKIRKNTDIE